MNFPKVYLVGAGPGAADLLTIRARKALENADVVIYDYLVDSSVLNALNPRCEKIDVGKKSGFHALPQEEIQQLMLSKVREGKRVVRLKGGDPLIFGRGADEARFLLAHDVPCEIVPGITAAVGAAAELGLPLTHRSLASSVTFVTGHEDPTKKVSMIDWKSLATTKGTLCFYMGVGRLQEICTELQTHGMSGDTPAAVVRWATTPRQETLICKLSELHDLVVKKGIKSPAIIFIGQTAGEILWMEPRPEGRLAGKRVAVTRPREQALTMIQALEKEGAEVLALPLISIYGESNPEIREEVFQELGYYEWLVFTSRSGVRFFFDEFFRKFNDIRSLGFLRIAAVGPGTAEVLREYRLQADLIPDAYDAVSLADKMEKEISLENTRVLVVTGSRNDPLLVERLNGARAIVDTFQVYRTDLTDLTKWPDVERFRKFGVDAITFTSGSTVESFVKQAKHLQPEDPTRARPYTLSIGPVTSEALRKAGIPVDMEAGEASYAGMVEALVRFFEKSKS